MDTSSRRVRHDVADGVTLMDTSSRRVRHDVADGVTLMVFSLAMSASIAGITALLVGLAA